MNRRLKAIASIIVHYSSDRDAVAYRCMATKESWLDHKVVMAKCIVTDDELAKAVYPQELVRSKLINLKYSVLDHAEREGRDTTGLEEAIDQQIGRALGETQWTTFKAS